MDTLKLTPKQEKYVQLVASGMSQRKAYRAAYPRSEKWRDKHVDTQASELLKTPKVHRRYEALRAQNEKLAEWTREQSLKARRDRHRMAQTTIEREFEKSGKYLTFVAKEARDEADGLDRLTGADQPEVEVRVWTADFGLLLAPSFLEFHRAVHNHSFVDYVLKGGRGSTKSSAISLEVINLLMQNEYRNAVIMRRVQNTLRSSVFNQLKWAIEQLGVGDEWELTVSPMQMIHKTTGQVIAFFGLDDEQKIKSYKPPKGYVAIQWYEEANQFKGMEQIRSVRQSLTRGEGDHWRFMSFNPPKSRSDWVNEEFDEPKDDTTYIHASTYQTVPREWLGSQFFADAQALKEINEDAYRHEYLGEAVGTGGDVFRNLEIRDITEDELSNIKHIRCGVDFGYAPDPWVFVRVGYDEQTKTAYVFDESYGLRLSDETTANRIIDRLSDESGTFSRRAPMNKIYCDRELKAIATYQEMGLNAVAAPKRPGSVDYGTKWLQERYKIVVDPKFCPLAAHEFSHYEYEELATGQLGGYPDKDNHTIDAVRYAMTEMIESRRAV